MSTFAQLIEEVQSHLRSYTRDQELSTHLIDDLTVDGLTLTVDDTSVLSRGRVEIDSELIWLSRVDREGATATIPPYGRGMDSTTAAVHAAGSRVVTQPLFPRQTVKNQINQTINSIGGQLYGVAEEVLDVDTSFIYEVPAGVRDILTVQMTDVSEYGDVFYLRDWQLDKKAPSTISTTGKALYLYDGTFRHPEQIVISYSCDPVQFTAESQAFSTTLLPASAEDVVVLLSASKLLATAEAYKLNTRAVESSTVDAKYQPGSAVSQSKYLFQLGQARLAEERLRLLNSTANRSHYVR